jgi:hypothetical protein
MSRAAIGVAMRSASSRRGVPQLPRVLPELRDLPDVESRLAANSRGLWSPP